jgi:cell division protein FtsZ
MIIRSHKIAVVGVGGAGQNMVDYLKSNGLNAPYDVRYIAANSDWKSLERCQADILLPLGAKSFNGIGTNGNVRLGQECAIQSRESILSTLIPWRQIFIVAGLGGGTGTGATIEIARMSDELSATTVVLVPLPFSFEGKKRTRSADEGLTALREITDATIALPNEWLRGLASSHSIMREMFDLSNEYIRQVIQGLVNLSW